MINEVSLPSLPLSDKYTFTVFDFPLPAFFYPLIQEVLKLDIPDLICSRLLISCEKYG